MAILMRRTATRDPQAQQQVDHLTSSISRHFQAASVSGFTEGSKPYGKVNAAVGRVADSLIRGGEQPSNLHGALSDRLNLVSSSLQSKGALNVKNFEAVMDAAVEVGNDDPAQLRTALSMIPGQMDGVKPKTRITKRGFAAALGASVNAKQRELKQRKAITDFIDSSGNLSSGHDYSDGLNLVCNVPAAELAYATADVLGLSSKVVEEQVQKHLASQGLNPVKDRVAGYQAFNTQVSHALEKPQDLPPGHLLGVKSHAAELRQLSGDGASMLRLARAMSGLWNDGSKTHDSHSFKGSGLDPVRYLTLGQPPKGYSRQLTAPIIERAQTRDDIEGIAFHIRAYANADLSEFMPSLQARAKQLGVKMK